MKLPLLRCAEALSYPTWHRTLKTWGTFHFWTNIRKEIERFNQYPKTAFGFLEEDEGSWNLTEKVDGCLLVVTVFSSSHPVNVLLKPLLKEGDLDLWHCFFGGYLIIPATRGSIQVGSDMKSTLITAFYQTLVKRGQEEQLPDSSLSPDII